MGFESIRLQNFRSYVDAFFEFSPAVNIIVGPNASGKTNLLEAVLVIARGGSYRVKDQELINHHATWARLDTGGEDRAVMLEREDHHVRKRFKIHNQSVQRLHISKTVPVVLFEPNHLRLLTGSPELRRHFLDDILEQTTPGFASWRRQYKRVLAQRNALLKTGRASAGDQLFVWNIRLSEFGEQIARARHSLVSSMQERVQTLYSELAGTITPVTLQYDILAAPENYATALLHKLESHLSVDLMRGFTTHGPHREDLQILLHSHPAQETASRGETRTLVLTLKIIEAQQLEASRNTRPLLLFDDVFSELDTQRRQALTQFLQPYQTFITTTDADTIARHVMKQANNISLTK